MGQRNSTTNAATSEKETKKTAPTIAPRPIDLDAGTNEPKGIIPEPQDPEVRHRKLRRHRGPFPDPSSFRTTIIEKKTKEALIVAAIDFGTTYSGYAYAFYHKPDEILANYWDGGVQVKTPTVVLMDSNKRFVAFGHEARTRYQELMKTGKHKQFYFLEKFKMKLFGRELPLDKDMEIEDILEKKIKAIDVFTSSIKYMRDHLMQVLNDPNRKDQVRIEKETDIRWVLTVPAIWGDLAKTFMREAAEKAGIPGEMLSLALEPEGASLFCKQELGVSRVPTGHRYVVLDLGGGTADITCHEVNEDGTLKELHPPTGGDFGGTMVDEEFFQMLYKVFGANIIRKYKTDCMGEYWEFVADFEIKKRKFDGSSRVVLKFPVRLLDLYEEEVEMSVNDSIEQSNLAGEVEFKQGKLFLSDAKMKAIFDGTISKITQTTDELLEKVERIDNIILVGGFSESPYLQKIMKEHFKKVIILPKEPSAAVLKGAVIYGLNPRNISSRKCRYTYGIARMVKFIEGQHPERKKVQMGRFTFCDDIFCKHIEIGTEVSVDSADKAEEIEYFPPSVEVKQAVLEVYKSSEKDPVFVTDSDCSFVGLIPVEIDPQGNVWSKLLVKLIFGGTELVVQVKDINNRHIIKGYVEFHG